MIKKDDFGALCEYYLEEIDVKPQSKQNYRKILLEFTRYVTSLSDLPTRRDVMNYRESLITRGLKAGSIQMHMVVIRNFYRWFHIEGYGPNVSEGVKGMKIQNDHKKEALSLENSQRLLKRAKYLAKFSLIGKRDYALIALLITTGLRTVEVERADIDDIDEINGTYLLYIMGKGRDDKDASVKLSPQVYAILEHYLTERNDQYKPLFISHRGKYKGGRMQTHNIRDVVKRLLRDIELTSDRYSAHSLRHTTATLALERGANIEEVQQQLRHKDPKTTLIYMHQIRKRKDSIEHQISDELLGPIKKQK